MRVLIVGGTRFIGRHVVERLRERGHEVTLLNRGLTSPQTFADLPLLRTDRQSADLAATPGLVRDWDAVIDLSAYFPADVARLLDALRGRAGRYVLCSTVSVYEASALEAPTPMIREEDPLRTCSVEQAADPRMSAYGPRKAECERVALARQAEPGGAPVVILRPSVVFGEHDPTDRLAWWYWRAASPERFILPDDGLTITRRTYAPDLARAFEAALSAPRAEGQAYNIAETDPLSFRDTLLRLGESLGTRPLERAVPVPAPRLLELGIRPWQDLPLWLPRLNLLIDTFKSRRDLGFVSTDPERALSVASRAFLALGKPPSTGLTAEAEREVLERLGAH